MRGINKRFIEDLLSGELHFFLEQVKSKPDLFSLQIRDNYINIYYRGGNLLKISQKIKGYSFHFDIKYCLNKDDTSSYTLLGELRKNCAEDYLKYFSLMVEEMDSWFLVHPKQEREFQQKLLISNKAVIDIEYQINYKDSDNKNKAMRFDMLMLDNNRLIIVENKYGIGAISGSAGLAKHYFDICNVLQNEKLYKEISQSVINISYAKHQLGLIDYCTQEIASNETEILFLLANFNKKSEKIKKEVKRMTYLFPARLLMLDKDQYSINYKNSEDLFIYES